MGARRFVEGLYQALRLKRNQSRVWPQIMIEVILEAAPVQTVAVTVLSIRSSCSSRRTFNLNDLLPLLFLLQM